MHIRRGLFADKKGEKRKIGRGGKGGRTSGNVLTVSDFPALGNSRSTSRRVTGTDVTKFCGETEKKE